jgi:hypothetical protein
MRPEVLHAPKHLYSVELPKLGFGFYLDNFVKNSFIVRRFVRPQLHDLIIHLQFWFHSSLFLLVFFDSQARISLLGEVGRATLVNNLRRRGATIAGFEMYYSEAGSNCVATPPNRELTEPFGRSGTLVHINCRLRRLALSLLNPRPQLNALPLPSLFPSIFTLLSAN